MCLNTTKKSLEKTAAIKKTGKSITVYKVMREVNGRISTPYQNHEVQFGSDLVASKPYHDPHSNGRRVTRGAIHCFVGIPHISELFEKNKHYFKATVRTRDIIAFGGFYGHQSVAVKRVRVPRKDSKLWSFNNLMGKFPNAAR